MDAACQVLADTGMNSSTVVLLAVSLVLAGFLLVYLIRHRQLARGVFMLFGLVLAGHLMMATHIVRAAPADCQSASGVVAQTPLASGQLNLVNDTFNKNNGFVFDAGSGEWSGEFNILANDQPPSADPIDPSTIRFSNPSFGVEDYGVNNGEPANTDMTILDNASNPIGDIYLDWDYDVNNNPVYTGKIYISLYNGTPTQTRTIDYTATTLGGVIANHTAVISFTNELPPPPVANNDNPTADDLSYNNNSEVGPEGWSGSFSVLSNDQAQPGDPINHISLINPSDSSLVQSYTQDLGPDGSITWTVNGNQIDVFIDSSVPLGTPVNIQYVITSNAGVQSNFATVSVAR